MLITKKKRRKQLIDLYGDMENFNLSLSCLFFFTGTLYLKINWLPRKQSKITKKDGDQYAFST